MKISNYLSFEVCSLGLRCAVMQFAYCFTVAR